MITREEWKKDRDRAVEILGKAGIVLTPEEKERMEEILTTHEPKPLTDDQEDAIENILEGARNYYEEKGLM